MTQSGKLINGGLALILISSSGCAGNGLRNMFSRNETAGYKTLEELEEERIAKENSDESGPRFASWLPFGKKTADEAESEALADADDAVEPSEEGKKKGWWKNPFRRQETIEADPFLENELPTEVVVAGKSDAKAKAEGAASTVKGKTAKDVAALQENSVRKVSATTESVAPEDDLLVEKFEKHFQQTTEAAVSSADESSDMIVAGVEDAKAGTAAAKKKAVSGAGSVSTAADEKLAEFEELLAAKKEAASKARKEINLDEEFEAASDAADEFAESIAETRQSTTKQARATRNQASASVDEFDSLFEPSEKPVAAKKKKTTTSRPSSADKSSGDVKVAQAEDIFGAGAVSGNGSRQTKKTATSGGWKGEDSESSLASAGNSGNESELARKVIDKTVDQFAAMFSGARNSGGAPVAAAPDADEWTAAPGAKAGSAGRRGIPVRTASNGRELGAPLDTPAGLKDDRFFSGDNNAPLVTNLQAVPTSETTAMSVPAVPVIRENAKSKATGSAVRLPSTFSVRNIVLVIGGIIVAALLFAPGRKKPTAAGQVSAQG